jgi:alpha-beta hydrolase superfamily lysophospholipase
MQSKAEFLQPHVVMVLLASIVQLITATNAILILIVFGAFSAVYSQERRVQDLLTGDGRRRLYPPRNSSHPRPNPHWKTSDEIEYTCDFVGEQGKRIWYQCFRPISPRGIIVAMHGYADHSDYRMHELSHDLAETANMVVYAFDQPGFGRSDGLWAYIPDWFDHVHTCARGIIEILRKSACAETLPVFAYGHSMGGGLAITLSVLYQKLFTGIVLSAPMCGINPSLRKNRLLEQLFFKLAELFPTLPITPVPDLSRLCYRDEEFWKQERAKNRLAYPLKPRLGTARSMLSAQTWIANNASSIIIPFLIVHGDCDLVTSLIGSIDFHAEAGSPDKEIEVVKGGYHIMMGYGLEPNVSKLVLNRIATWLKKRAS